MMALSLSLIKFLLTGKLDDDGKTLEIEVFGKLGWQVNLYVTESKVVVGVATKWRGGRDATMYLVCAIWCWPRCASMLSFTTY